ncbi:MAG: methyltransferase family protein [Leptospirillia bacterium]
MPSDINPRDTPRWKPLEQSAYRLRIFLLAIPFVLAMGENARHPFPLWSFSHVLWGAGTPILPLERKLLMLPALCLYAGGLFLRLSGSSILGIRSVWSRRPEAHEFHSEGLYGIIRHPIYLGSAGMILSLSLISSPQGALLLVGVDIPLLFWFSLIEEREVMALHPEYAHYRERVPRILPHLPLPPGTLRDSWSALRQNLGQSLRSEALNVALLAGFIVFWFTPNLHFFWEGALLGLLVGFSAPAWWRTSGGHVP